MSDVIYKMYGSVVATNTDSIASIDIQDDGFIEGIFMEVRGSGMDALADTVQGEIGFGSSNTFGINDVRSSILTVTCIQNFLTSGGGSNSNAVFTGFSKGLVVSAGERIHMHGKADTGCTMTCNAYLYVVKTGQGRLARRNR